MLPDVMARPPSAREPSIASSSLTLSTFAVELDRERLADSQTLRSQNPRSQPLHTTSVALLVRDASGKYAVLAKPTYLHFALGEKCQSPPILRPD